MQSKDRKKSSSMKLSGDNKEIGNEAGDMEAVQPTEDLGSNQQDEEEDDSVIHDENTIQLLQAVRKSNIQANEKEEIIQRVEMYKGPLPPPALLDQYEKVVPGLAQQIVDMAVNEQKHQHKINSFQMRQIADAFTEEKAIYEERIEFIKGERELKQQRQWIYFALAGLCIIIMGIAILMDKSIMQMSPVIGALGALALMLIFGKKASGDLEVDHEVSEEDESVKDESVKDDENDEDDVSDEDENSELECGS